MKKIIFYSMFILLILSFVSIDSLADVEPRVSIEGLTIIGGNIVTMPTRNMSFTYSLRYSDLPPDTNITIYQTYNYKQQGRIVASDAFPVRSGRTGNPPITSDGPFGGVMTHNLEAGDYVLEVVVRVELTALDYSKTINAASTLNFTVSAPQLPPNVIVDRAGITKAPTTQDPSLNYRCWIKNTSQRTARNISVIGCFLKPVCEDEPHRIESLDPGQVIGPIEGRLEGLQVQKNRGYYFRIVVNCDDNPNANIKQIYFRVLN